MYPGKLFSIFIRLKNGIGIIETYQNKKFDALIFGTKFKIIVIVQTIEW